MIKFEYYSGKYSCVKMERREGILQMTLHTKGVDLKCGISAHEELSYASMMSHGTTKAGASF